MIYLSPLWYDGETETNVVLNETWLCLLSIVKLKKQPHLIQEILILKVYYHTIGTTHTIVGVQSAAKVLSPRLPLTSEIHRLENVS